MGLVIGSLYAPVSLLLYWWHDDPEELTRGVEAIFSVETQVFLLFALIGTLIIVPLLPVVLRLSIFIYDAILFGLSFIYASAFWFCIASYFLEEPDRAQSILFELLVILVVMATVVAAIGPIILEEFEDYTVSRNRWRIFSGKKRHWWLFYSGWVAALVTFAIFGIGQLQ